MEDKNPSSRYGIICPKHGAQGLTHAQYRDQMNSPNELWHCPLDGCMCAGVKWDDDRYESGPKGPPPKGEMSHATESTNSKLNTSSAWRYTPKFTFGEQGNKNTCIFLYEDTLFVTVEDAQHWVADKFLMLFFIGLHPSGVHEVPPDSRVPHVEATVEDMMGQQYKIALLSGPEFDKHFNADLAEQTDLEENRKERQKEQAQRLDQQHYEHEVRTVNEALHRPDNRLH